MKKEQQYTKDLIGAIQKTAGKKNLLNEFLIDILTPSEYKEIARRWQIVKQLAKGIPQRKIAQDLKIGIATVTRGSKEWRDKKGGFRKILRSKT